jgi:hypothetical protein
MRIIFEFLCISFLGFVGIIFLGSLQHGHVECHKEKEIVWDMDSDGTPFGSHEEIINKCFFISDK